MSKSGKIGPPGGTTCSSCGFANPAGHRFCGGCGSRLAGDGRGSARVVAERRQLTVVFCDLVGSTRLAASLELEELQAVIRGFQSACAEAVRQHGGTITRYMGDGILILFGYPQAHEDDAERAVRAGLAMAAAVAGLPLHPNVGAPLAIRVGIATGLVVAGDLIGTGSAEEEAVLGETPNLAARLQSAAPPGGVVVSASTQALLGGRFLCEDLGERPEKGFDGAVRRWRVLGPRSVTSHFKAQAGAGHAPLVGREEELAWLLGLWRSVARRRGRIVTLAGEAGIGKSRVAESLRERLGDACVPLRYQCAPHYVNRALHPVIQHVEIAARIGHEDAPAAKLQKLAAWLGPLADDTTGLALLAALLSIPADVAPPVPPMSAQRQKQETFDFLLRILGGHASARPLLVIFEDLHWSDPTTLEFLAAVAARIDGMAALAVLTFRSGFKLPWGGVEGRELQRLPREPALRLVEQVAGAGRMTQAVVEQLVARADGIPLFVEELTRAVIGLGLLEDAGRAPLPAVAIPSTLQDSLMARLDQLGSAKLVAQLASAIGREFGYPLLEAIAPLAPERLRAELGILEEAGLVHPKGATVGEVFAFKHALVQAVAYQTLLRGRREELHARIARALEEQFPRHAADAPELLAHHWTEAGEVERAVDRWLLAGERASERSEYSEAIGHLEKGRGLVGRLADPSDRVRRELALLLALGPALMMVTGAGTAQVAGLYARALELCSALPKSGQHFAARWGRWRAAMNHRDGRVRADELLQLATEIEDPAHLVQAHHAQWATLYMLGKHEECCRHADEGIRLYDPERHHLHAHLYGGHDPKVCGLGERALSAWLLGRVDESVQSVRLALDWADRLGHVGSRVHAMDYALQVHRLRRDAAEVARRGEEMIAFADEQHLAEHRAKGMIFRGWARAQLGDLAGGLDDTRRALEWEEESGTPEDFPLYYEMFAEVCSRAGRFEEGLAAVTRGFAQAERGRIVFWNAELGRRRGELILAAGGDAGEARACFERALVEARGQGALSLRLRAATSLARMGAGEAGGRAARRLGAVCARFPRGLDSPDLRDARAVLAARA